MPSPSFKYPGGKATIRSEILPYIPVEGSCYIEPFAGSGNMFFLVKEHCDFEDWRLNDLNSYNFLCALRDSDLSELGDYDFEMLRVANTPVAAVLEYHVTVLSKGYKHGGSGARCTERFTSNCYRAQELLQGVLLFNHQWYELEYPTDCFAYFDPPYYGSYTHYGQIDHEALLQFLMAADFDWILSGYFNDLYLAYLGEPFKTIEKAADMSNFNGATSESKYECLWSNL